MGQKQPLMNDTKWDELRVAMYDLGEQSPRWRIKNIDSGYISRWDGEWYYHFSDGGYARIEWLELEITKPGARTGR